MKLMTDCTKCCRAGCSISGPNYFDGHEHHGCRRCRSSHRRRHRSMIDFTPTFPQDFLIFLHAPAVCSSHANNVDHIPVLCVSLPLSHGGGSEYLITHLPKSGSM